MTMAVELSKAARELLLEVSRDSSGLILRLTASGGSALLKTNGRTFGDGTPREQAEWVSGVRQLMRLGLIEAQGDRVRVFCITEEGHGAANGLRRRSHLVTIILTESSRQCLLESVMPGSLSHVTLTAATRLPDSPPTGNQVVVQCELEVAAALLVLATHSCQEAVSNIESAIVEARGRSAPGRNR